MPSVNIGNTTQSDMVNKVTDYAVSEEQTNGVTGLKETIHINTEWSKELGYFNTTPQLNRSLHALSIWTAGKGYTCDEGTRILLDHISGMREDTFSSILMNMLRVKKYGRDAYAHIIRDDGGTLVNLKVLDTGSMSQIVGSDGILIRYEQVSKTPGKSNRKYKPEEIFHLCNDRNADSVQGSSVADLCEWVILAKQEAMNDWKRISHRSTIRVLYIEVDNVTRLNTAKTQYAEAIDQGELLIIPAKKGEAEFGELTLPPIDAFLRWMQYLDDLFYTIIGVPKVIATSENYTEAGGKTGFLTFEPVYTSEQVQLEKDIYNQLGIKIIFKRPPSLMDNLQSDQAKDSGQVAIQPGEVKA